MRTVHSREALASLKERFGEQVFDTVIRASIAYAESAERARSILDHRPDLGADYIALARGTARAPAAGSTGAAGERVAELAQSSPRRRRPAARTARASACAQPSTSRASASATAPVCS